MKAVILRRYIVLIGLVALSLLWPRFGFAYQCRTWCSGSYCTTDCTPDLMDRPFFQHVEPPRPDPSEGLSKALVEIWKLQQQQQMFERWQKQFEAQEARSEIQRRLRERQWQEYIACLKDACQPGGPPSCGDQCTMPAQ